MPLMGICICTVGTVDEHNYDGQQKIHYYDTCRPCLSILSVLRLVFDKFDRFIAFTHAQVDPDLAILYKLITLPLAHARRVIIMDAMKPNFEVHNFIPCFLW